MEIDDKTLQSVLILKNLFFKKITFERDKQLPKKFKADFNPVYNNVNDNEIEIELTCNITSDTTFVMEIVMCALFENTETDIAIKEQINKINTLSIMFPYLRAEISLITAQPNFPTINLPVINIIDLLKNKGIIEGERN